MKTVFGVKWIEVEFGQRPMGWRLYADREVCEEKTREGSRKGAEGGSYIGPERPLKVYEIPMDCVPKEVRRKLKKNGSAWSADRWTPQFKDKGTTIEP